MDAERWRRVETIFAGAADLPLAEREAYVRARAGGDAALEAEVRALLEADAKSASIVDAPALGAKIDAGADAESQAKKSQLLGAVLDGRYRLDALLGQGGMGSVYRGEHTGTGRRVAVKVISPDVIGGRGVLRRFQVEARAAGKLESPHVAQVLDVGFDERTRAPYLAIELLEGADVAELVAQRGALPTALALKVAAQACKGLEAAHAEGIIHRDIKPANLFLARGPEASRVVKVLDFGIAKLQGDELSSGSAITQTGTLIGSPLYMSPEQALGAKDLDARTDLWSLGVVLFELLAGVAPFERGAPLASLLVAITSGEIPALRTRAPFVPPEVAAVVDRMLRRERAERFASAAEVLSALRALLPDGLEIRDAHLADARPDATRTAALVRVDAPPGGTSGLSSTVLLVDAAARAVEDTGVSGAATIPELRPERARTARARWIAAGVLVVASAVLVGGQMNRARSDGATEDAPASAAASTPAPSEPSAAASAGAEPLARPTNPEVTTSSLPTSDSAEPPRAPPTTAKTALHPIPTPRPTATPKPPLTATTEDPLAHP